MPLFYAEDAENKLICAEQAKKNTPYFCPYCKKPTRLRLSKHARPHYFHLNPACGSAPKSKPHIAIQNELLQRIGEDKLQLEQAFPRIGRIADACWEEKKIVFEVQCSSISEEEYLQRNEDYESLAYYSIWIWHEDLKIPFKREERTHYYSDIDSDGKGSIFDKVSDHSSSFDIKIEELYENKLRQKLPEALVTRQSWKYFAKGDLLYLKIFEGKDLLPPPPKTAWNNFKKNLKSQIHSYLRELKHLVSQYLGS